MNKITTPKQVSRRRFVGITLATGVVAAAGLSFFHSRRKNTRSMMDFSPDTPLVRNPAYTVVPRSNGLILAATNSKRERIAFRMDAQARELWQSVPSTEEHRDGKRVTAAQILDAIVEKFPGQDAFAIRQEASEFLEAALLAGIIVKPGMKICVVNRVKKPA